MNTAALRHLWPALLLALIAGLALSLLETQGQQRLRGVQWDLQQKLSPRVRVNDSVVIVAIDDESLAQLGQWPWPRQRLATLMRRIQAAKPAAVGIDVVFAEADRYSHAALTAALTDPDAPAPPPRLPTLPDGDEALAQAWQGAPLVIGAVGLFEALEPATGPLKQGPSPTLSAPAKAKLPKYADALRSLPKLRQSAWSEALLDAQPEAGLVRALPTLVQVGSQLVPSLPLALIQHLEGAAQVGVEEARGRLHAVRVGAGRIATDANGGWRLHYSAFQERPHLSAAALLSRPDAASVLSGRVVLLGYTASGLLDVVTTPLGAMPGIEVHAEALDNYFDARLLHRPSQAALIEALAFLSLTATGLVLLLRRSAGLAIVVSSVLVGLWVLLVHQAFLHWGWLLDAAAPVLAAGLVVTLQMVSSLAQTRAQRRALTLALQHSREQQARLQGELDAARRIQHGMLPDPSRLHGLEPSVDLAASMQAARWVGGDFYDCFLENQRLWFLVGDVSGKGLPAALFMALVKGALRRAASTCTDAPGLALRLTAAGLGSENAEQQFVTVLMGCLNPRTGQLQLASAGHEAPWRLSQDGRIGALALAGGPPIGVLDDFDYPSEAAQLQPGEGLCLFTDGATDVLNPARKMLGKEGFLTQLIAAQAHHALRQQLQCIEQGITAFQGAAELADDITLLLLRWAPLMVEHD